ncbi:MAG: UDP-glucose/GDP-mannose dehydrogenase family protein [Candidatus Accumulibacter sp.]|uniref:UDP-glucose dehydrogenase family protein n=1 Tax=Accumulibacter sp. TaxID=2053492 RepID=UPI002879FF48|nr:UDP-glucose/GDP-mannose dehydrogenase family protein [Accumulibacter sp.]MDS4016645.1 UDP-glucose/GDP-mannose dehydrogenase family protein [Accumulibacter sp.]
MKIVIMGSGYVGLVSGVGLAEIGHEVVCVDVASSKVAQINSGTSPIYEEGLDALLKKNVAARCLRATTNLAEAMVGAEISMIAVGTPFDGKEIDLSFIRQAAIDIGNTLQYAADYHVVCVKSTVVPGTTQDVVGPLLERASGRRMGEGLGLCMNPEFLAEGTAVKDFMEPDRIVIGSVDARTSALMQEMYSAFASTDFVLTTPVTAEMCKYAANSFLAATISFANEIANLCSEAGEVDAIEVLKAVHLDRRLSPLLPQGRVKPGLMSFLIPGTGFGGSCFPKDVKALVSYGAKIGRPMRILEAVLETNRKQPSETIKLVKEELGLLSGKRIAVLGLAFKPGTDDVRESPAMPLIRALLKEGAHVVAHDPIAIPSMKAAIPEVDVDYCACLSDAIRDVAAVVLVTSWPQYAAIHNLLDSQAIPIIDGRRFLDKRKFARYRGIGLGRMRSEGRAEGGRS